MTAALEPALAAAYVHELSADVRAVVVLDADGERLSGPEHLAAPAGALTAVLSAGIVVTDAGVVWVARGPELTLVALAGPTAQTGATGLDIAAAAGATTAVEAVKNPSPELKTAVERLLTAS